MIAAILDSVEEKTEFSRLTLEYVKFLNNYRAQKALTEMFKDKPQIKQKISVTDLERDLWMSETPKPQPVNQI